MRRSLSAFAVLLAFPITALAAPDADEAVVSIDGKPAVTARDFNRVLEDLPPQAIGGQDPAKVRAYITQRLVGEALLSKAAADAGVRKTEEYQEVLKSYERFLEREIYLRQKFNVLLTDDKLKALYDQRFSAESIEEEVRARHILVDSEAKAKELIAALDKGGNFNTLAAENSTDGSAAEGGDLGWFPRGRMVKPFADAAFALKAGEYTKTPVKSEFGWHVIKLEDRRKESVPPFEEVKEQLREDSINTLRTEVLKELSAKTKVEVNEKVIETIPVGTSAGK